ncbi:RidA family protein [Actinomadura madurae]|uniref:RidA family protein n=1 Tax=Actinomadura madurae TaxID=1993 RepID=UPI000AA2DA2E|nr:RidA family protein [Actinomadura madurae]
MKRQRIRRDRDRRLRCSASGMRVVDALAPAGSDQQPPPVLHITSPEVAPIINNTPEHPNGPGARWSRQLPTREGHPVTLEFINPENLPTPPTYTHVVVATGNTMVFIAGQEPEDAQGDLVGAGDLAAQARQVFANLGHALAAAGTRPDRVVKITIYVVGHRPEYLPVIEQARLSLFGDHRPADSLVGVETLSRPEYLIEVDAIAVSDV